MKTWWIRGKTKHADLSSQSWSHPRAAGRLSMDKWFNHIHSIRSDDIFCWVKKKKSKMCLVQMLKCQMCHIYSPSGWGACPGLSSCLSLSDTSENSKQSSVDFREKLETCRQMRLWGKQKSQVSGDQIRRGTCNKLASNSMKHIQARGSDLGHEQALLVVQAWTHNTLQGFLQGLISGGWIKEE